MSDTRDITLVLENAAAAAARGDYAAAEQQLRQAASLQEATLGPGHPDLANTLNNIGVVCDLLGKPDDAELCYRRAFALATAALAPTHEFVATSRRNLQEFYRARGRYTEAAALDVTASGRRGGRAEAPVVTTRGEEGRDALPAPSMRWTAVPALALVAGVIVLVTFVGWLGTLIFPASEAQRSTRERLALPGGPEPTMAAERRPEADEPATAARPATADAAPAALAKIEPPPVARPAEPSVAATRPTGSLAPEGAGTGDRTGAATARPSGGSAERKGRGGSAVANPEVAAAEVCGSLSTPRNGGTWRCDPIAETEGGRTIFFYTRVRSEASTKVQHRWYRDDELQRTVELTVGSSALEGYRTYSSQRLGKDAAGQWRVELRTADGDVLHEARVMVR